MTSKEEQQQKEIELHRRELDGFTPLFYNESLPFKRFPVEKYNELVNSNSYSSVKIVHFVRHGQGFHNKLVLDIGYGCQCNTDNPIADCPYKNEEITDAKLTEMGKSEATKVQKFLAENDNISIDYVLTSPLSRAAETGIIALSHNKYQNITWKSLEVLREQYGVHVCDKRRSKSYLSKTFANIDISHIESENDTWFDENERESREHLAERIQRFLEFAKNVEENNIAVFTHSSFLFTMSGEWFKTGELRSFAIAFNK